MAEENWLVQVSLKVEQDMVNLRGDTVDEVASKMDEYLEKILPRLIATHTLVKSGMVAGGQPPVQQSVQRIAPVAPIQSAPPYQQPQTQPAPAVTGNPVCAHGEMKPASGNGSKGPWAGWFCPTPKGTPGQCPPVWQK